MFGLQLEAASVWVRRMKTSSTDLPGKTACFGEADGGTRTPDPFITSEVLYQLSYVGISRGASATSDREE